MNQLQSRCTTRFLEDAIDTDTASSLYLILKDTILWEEGVRSKYGFTRKAKALNIGDVGLIDEIIEETLCKFKILGSANYAVAGIYLNYYENGKSYTPNHSHKDTHQLVISLGATRTLKVGSSSYSMNNGSAILFGSSSHGIPKETNVNEGRISIATFMIPVI